MVGRDPRALGAKKNEESGLRTAESFQLARVAVLEQINLLRHEQNDLRRESLNRHAGHSEKNFRSLPFRAASRASHRSQKLPGKAERRRTRERKKTLAAAPLDG